MKRFLLPFSLLVVCACLVAPGLVAQTASQNINMVSGTTWSCGDHSSLVLKETSDAA